jgi:hypothetical protein
MNGNWAITGTISTNNSLTMGANLSTNGSSITGIMHVYTACFMFSGNILYDVPVTGTISSAGALTLISSPIASQVLSISGQWNTGAVTSGTYSIKGGCDDGLSGTIYGSSVPAFTGSYSGTFTSKEYLGLSTGVKVSMSQSAADSEGFYYVTGTATFTGSPCYTNGNISSSLIFGNYIQAEVDTANGPIIFIGTVDSTGKTITGQYSALGNAPKCNSDYGTGSIIQSQ